MLIRDFKSKEDYKRKLEESNKYLDTKIEVDKYLKTMNENYKNPNFQPVLPKQKTQTELLQDKYHNLNTLIENLVKLGYDRQLSSDVAMSFSIDQVNILNAFWNEIERYITKHFNIKYITPHFLKNYSPPMLKHIVRKRTH